MKKFKFPLIFVGALLVIQLLVLGYGYFVQRDINPQMQIIGYLIASVILWIVWPVKISRKILLMILTFSLSSALGILLFFLIPFLPAQKEHDRIMFEICIPALEKHYGIQAGENLPHEPVDGKGNPKWWYQHLECEENVWAGKGPLFSENPPDFRLK